MNQHAHWVAVSVLILRSREACGMSLCTTGININSIYFEVATKEKKSGMTVRQQYDVLVIRMNTSIQGCVL